VLAPVLALWMTHPSVVVEGQATCPSPAEVQRRVQDLMAGVPDAVAQDRARVDRTSGGLHVDLRRDDGNRIADRVIASAGSCADLASAAAVIVATWEAQLRPERTARINLPGEDRSAPAAVAVSAPAAPPAAPPRARLEVGLGATGSLAFGDDVEPALGGLVFGSWAPRPSGPGVYAAASAATTRTSTLTGTVTTSWTRAAIAVGPSYRVLAGPARLDAHAAALAGLLFVSAAGVPSARSDTSSDFGAALGVRVSTRWDPMAPWLGLEGQLWPARDHLEISGPAGTSMSRTVPRVEGQLAVGFSFGRI
jgi:hypothetical protein